MVCQNKICVLDFETDSLDNNFNQPVSIAAVMIDGRSLKICDNGIFYSLISRIPDSEVEKYGLSKLDPKSMSINGISESDLESAPPLKLVWTNFINWVKYFNPKPSKWDGPILSGHNHKYDRKIIERIMYGTHYGQKISNKKSIQYSRFSKMTTEEQKEYFTQTATLKEPWKLGPQSEFFHPGLYLDSQDYSHILFENTRNYKSISLSNVKSLLGFKDDAEIDEHHALVDTMWSAEIIVRYISLMRQVLKDVDFETQNKTHLDVHQQLKNILQNEKED